MSDEEKEAKETEAVDQQARDKIEKLEKRLEGARLTPNVWTIIKQAIHSTLRWPGWEIIGLGFATIAGLAIICGGIFGISNGCQQMEIDRYRPACAGLGMEYVESSKSVVTCAGDNRVVKIDTDDLDETESLSLDDARVVKILGKEKAAALRDSKNEQKE